MCRIILAMAATYNLGFAVWLGLWPGAVFALFAMTPPWPAQVSQVLATAIGLFALVYGYAVAWPEHTHPIVMLGLLSKIVPPIAWALVVILGDWPPRTFVLILCDDLVWWFPFGYCLWAHGDATSKGTRCRAAG